MAKRDRTQKSIHQRETIHNQNCKLRSEMVPIANYRHALKHTQENNIEIGEILREIIYINTSR